MTQQNAATSTLPRGRCATCGRDVAVRRNGSVREHRPPGCTCGHSDGAHARFIRACRAVPRCSCAVYEPATNVCPGSGKAAAR